MAKSSKRQQRLNNTDPFSLPGESRPSLQELTDVMLSGDKSNAEVENQQLRQELESIREQLNATQLQMQHALTIADKGSGIFEFQEFTLTSCGLLPNQDSESVEFGSWSLLGDLLFRLEGSIQWLIGDWLLYGEHHYGKTYEWIAQQLGREKSSLYQYKYVAEKVDFSIRIEKLTFGHHQLIAGKSVKEQKKWLGLAEKHGWSVARMRAEMKAKSHPQVSSTPLADKTHRRRFNRVWRALEQGGEIDETDLDTLIDWLQHIRKSQR